MTTRIPSDPRLRIPSATPIDAPDPERSQPSSRPVERGTERGTGRPSTVRRRLLARMQAGNRAQEGPPAAPNDLLRPRVLAPTTPRRGPAAAKRTAGPEAPVSVSPVRGRWKPISPDGQVLAIEQRVGDTLERVLAVSMRGRDLLVIHPRAWMGPADHEGLRSRGRVQIVLSLTGRDHEGVSAFVRQHLHAAVVAPRVAAGLLREHITAPVHDLSRLTPFLPDGIQLLQPGGLGRKEAWLQVPTAYGMAWIVGYAFANLETVPKGIRGWLQGFAGVKQGLHIPPMFRRKVLDDLGNYRAWLFRHLREARPAVLVPSDGPVIEDPSLATRLRSRVQDLEA